MDAQAYVLIGTKHGTVKSVAEKLLDHKEIVNIHILYGQHDIIIQIRVPTTKDLDNFMVNTIKSIQEIERTETMIVADSPIPLD
jgi:Lrp/AsnC family transcriptional regulator, leucine-responsive regulatory protein